jgi:single-strand DNA-binding protein
MNGLTCAFTGRLGRDPESKFTMSGKQMLQLNVAVDQDTRQTEERPDAETTWVKVTLWEERAAELEGKLSKGALVYCEGRLKLERWTKSDGSPQAGLSLSAWTVQPMGQIGRRRENGQQPAAAYRGGYRQERDEVPF